jgi:hypothetical protein
MKKIVSYLVITIALGGICVLLSFNSNNSKQRSLAITTYYYEGKCQRIQPGISGQKDPMENSLSCPELTNCSNWSKSGKSYSSLGNYIAAISFIEDDDEDGGDDGQLTLSETLKAICHYYVSQVPEDLPYNREAIKMGKAEIIVHRKAAI